MATTSVERAGLLVTAALAAAGCSGGGEEAHDGPDVVLIVVDTLRADHVLDPEGRVATPHLDALAADGIVFPRAFSHAPMTLPAHVALFSSRAPHESGVVNNYGSVPEDLPLLPEWMGRFGYTTTAVVSMGSLWTPERGETVDRGFERFVRSMPWLRPGDDVLRDLRHELPLLADRRPFFLFAHFGDPHEPYNAHGTAESPAQLVVDSATELLDLASAHWLQRTATVAPGGLDLSLRSRDLFRVRTLTAYRLGDTLIPEDVFLGATDELSVTIPNEERRARPGWLELVLASPTGDVPAGEVVVAGAPLGGQAVEGKLVVRAPVDVPPGGARLEVRAAGAFVVEALGLRERGARIEPLVEQGELYEPVRNFRARVPNDGDEEVAIALELWVSDRPAPDDVPERYRREVEYVDGWVGDLLQLLRDRGMYEDTLIVLTSDHGEGLGDHDWYAHVQNVYDELIHVPLIVKPPRGHTLEGALRERRAGLVRHMDVGPTVLELVGLPPLPGQRGLSLLEDGERVHLAETRKPEAPRDVLCLRDERYKLVYEADAGRFELYDLEADPGEVDDLYGRFAGAGHPRQAWEPLLRQLAEAWDAEGGELDPEDAARLRALGY